MFCAELGIKNIFEKLTKKLQKVFFQQYELIKDATMYHPCVVGLILTLLYTGGGIMAFEASKLQQEGLFWSNLHINLVTWHNGGNWGVT